MCEFFLFATDMKKNLSNMKILALHLFINKMVGTLQMMSIFLSCFNLEYNSFMASHLIDYSCFNWESSQINWKRNCSIVLNTLVFVYYGSQYGTPIDELVLKYGSPYGTAIDELVLKYGSPYDTPIDELVLKYGSPYGTPIDELVLKYGSPCGTSIDELVLKYWLIWFDFWCLTPLSAIFQLYHGDQF